MLRILSDRVAALELVLLDIQGHLERRNAARAAAPAGAGPGLEAAHAARRQSWLESTSVPERCAAPPEATIAGSAPITTALGRRLRAAAIRESLRESRPPAATADDGEPAHASYASYETVRDEAFEAERAPQTIEEFVAHVQGAAAERQATADP